MTWQPGQLDWEQLKETWSEASQDLSVYGVMIIRWRPDGLFERVDPYDVEIEEVTDEG